MAANAFNESALAKVFSLKNRPHFDPLIVHVLSDWDLSKWVKSATPLHQKLVKRFWPGPLTLLFERGECVPDLCTASTPWVAIRAPQHEVFKEVLRRVQFPLAAPSANRFGRISPTSAQDVVEELGAWGLRFILEGGACRLGLESTVVKIQSQNHIEVLRLGALSVEELSAFLGKDVAVSVSKLGSGMDLQKVEAPGQLLSHYAPRTPLHIVKEESFQSSPSVALLRAAGSVRAKENEWTLSSIENDQEAAAKLFQTLRKIDSLGFDSIQVILGPDRGLYRAINERLQKAAGSRLSL